ncbi:MAG: hypothetical protein OEW52_00310 [Thermoleophilia bacterium]|nr:hypothetical protein [Thermoleophilia bacterium]
MRNVRMALEPLEPEDPPERPELTIDQEAELANIVDPRARAVYRVKLEQGIARDDFIQRGTP